MPFPPELSVSVIMDVALVTACVPSSLLYRWPWVCSEKGQFSLPVCLHILLKMWGQRQIYSKFHFIFKPKPRLFLVSFCQYFPLSSMILTLIKWAVHDSCGRGECNIYIFCLKLKLLIQYTTIAITANMPGIPFSTLHTLSNPLLQTILCSKLLSLEPL